MKTDHPLYRFLTTGPEAFRLLSGGIPLCGPYRTSAPVLKHLERRIDGLLDPQGHDGPVWVIEFQAQPSPQAGYNLITKVGAYGESHPTRDVQGLLVLLHEGLRPERPRWLGQAGSGLTVVALVPMLTAAYAAEPENPHLAALAPLFMEAEGLHREGARLWAAVNRASDERVRETLSEVLVYWFFEVFKDVSAKEIWTMLNVLSPIEQTKAYQSILAEGWVKGKAEGKAEGWMKGKAEGWMKGKAEGKTEAKAETLKRQLTRRFGALPAWGASRIDEAPEAEVDQWLEGIFDAQSLEGLIGAPKA
jgi:predicted transposase YdaD